MITTALGIIAKTLLGILCAFCWAVYGMEIDAYKSKEHYPLFMWGGFFIGIATLIAMAWL